METAKDRRHRANACTRMPRAQHRTENRCARLSAAQRPLWSAYHTRLVSIGISALSHSDGSVSSPLIASGLSGRDLLCPSSVESSPLVSVVALPTVVPNIARSYHRGTPVTVCQRTGVSLHARQLARLRRANIQRATSPLRRFL